MKKNKKERRSNFGNFFRNNKFVLCLPGYDRVGAGFSVKRRNTIAQIPNYRYIMLTFIWLELIAVTLLVSRRPNIETKRP